MKQLPLDIELFPPFTGFPEEGIQFLKRLMKNNNRIWFAKHKSEYEDFVKFPMQCLIASLKVPMSKLVPEIDVNPKRSMFRIFRDTRFSKDKTPYKTHVAAVFHLKGHWQQSAGFYIEISPEGIYVGGGIYLPDKEQLKKIRVAIAEQAKNFLTIIEDSKFIKRFGMIQGEKLQRIPLDFPRDHFMGEWLKYKSYYTGVELKEKECYSPEFVDKIVTIYKELLPLIRFLNQALGKH
ncbi:MAG: DUF2461 domain-containing protein [Bacteroidota bacterium]|nr:DUF2461 domain-containing protein [Bacteroidota bacterium]